MVARQMEAADFLEAEFETDPQPAEGLWKLMDMASMASSRMVDVNVKDFLTALETEGKEPVAIRMEVLEQRSEDAPGLPESEGITRSPIVLGGAAFKGDRLVGWLDEREARGLLWIEGKVRGGVISVEHPRFEGRTITLKILSSRSRFFPRIEGHSLAMQIEVHAEVVLGESEAPVDPVREPEVTAGIERLAANEIEEEISAVLFKAQSVMHSDIVGLGAAVHRSSPRLWRPLKDRWDEEFPKVRSDMTVRVEMVRSGLSERSPMLREDDLSRSSR